MGSGKTTLAKILADALGWKAIEMDDLILKKSGRQSVAEIFEKDGESVFRKLEAQIAKELSNTNNKIISTGGGVIANAKNIANLKKNGRIIYLKDSFENIRGRLKKDKTRPLFQDLKKAKKLFQLRQPLYAKYADKIIDCAANPDLNRVSQEITKRLEKDLKKICLSIGDPIKQSLSPAMHNAGYRNLKIEDQHIFLSARVRPGELGNAVKAFRILGIRGISVTIPHKIEVMKYLDKIDKTAKIIGAVNTVVNNNGQLTGYNTDWLGAVIPLEKAAGKNGLKNKKTALLGTGGAARAIAYGLVKKGARLAIFGRNADKTQNLARVFKAEIASFAEIHEIKNFDIIINATSVGMAPRENESLVPAEFLHKNQIVFDAVYFPRKTKLLKQAEKKGAKIIPGLEMLLYQGAAQFELYTGKKAPVEAMRKSLNH
jgi:shikimate dehydrogenase